MRDKLPDVTPDQRAIVRDTVKIWAVVLGGALVLMAVVWFLLSRLA